MAKASMTIFSGLATSRYLQWTDRGTAALRMRQAGGARLHLGWIACAEGAQLVCPCPASCIGVGRLGVRCMLQALQAACHGVRCVLHAARCVRCTMHVRNSPCLGPWPVGCWASMRDHAHAACTRVCKGGMEGVCVGVMQVLCTPTAHAWMHNAGTEYLRCRIENGRSSTSSSSVYEPMRQSCASCASDCTRAPND